MAIPDPAQKSASVEPNSSAEVVQWPLSVRVPADHGRMVIRQELPRSGRSCRSAGFGRSCTEAAIHGALGFGWVRGVLPFALRVAAPRSTAARPPGWHASGIAICYRHVESHHRLGQSFKMSVSISFLGGTVPFRWKVDENGALIEVPEQQTVFARSASCAVRACRSVL